MIAGDPGEKGENVQSRYFCHKMLSFDAQFDGEFNGAISYLHLSALHTLVKKKRN